MTIKALWLIAMFHDGTMQITEFNLNQMDLCQETKAWAESLPNVATAGCIPGTAFIEDREERGDQVMLRNSWRGLSR